ncbi:DUF2911 domain-containing protein [Acidisarcina polymorpha]|nr:DUF2911 domain-containing protein [Acidisarcina polymorpha]
MLQKKLLCTIASLLLGSLATLSLQAQEANASNDYGKKLPSPPAKAHVELNGKLVTIDYNTPFMKGRKIFGGLVPYNEVWRTGANPATTLKTETAIMIGDLKVPAGTYTIYSLPSETQWKLIVNKQTGQWGTVYNEPQDLGRTDMQKGPTPAAPVEQFAIKFENTHGNKTELHLIWENTDVFVPVSAASK